MPEKLVYNEFIRSNFILGVGSKMVWRVEQEGVWNIARLHSHGR
jgi:hypothetical protein